MKKIAAIDIGTNSFHLIVVEIKRNGNFEIVDREKEVIRLGEGSTGDIKIISEEAIERAIITLKRFKGIADSHSAEMRAVATSAVRESSNKIEFLKRVYYETDIEIEVISGTEEARLIYLGMLKAIPIYEDRVCCIDIGGGSTEFLVGEKGNILYSVSLKLGAVRMNQIFFPNSKTDSEKIKSCRRWVEGEIFNIAKSINSLGVTKFAGSSGTIMSVGLMSLAASKSIIKPNTILNNFEISKKDFSKTEKLVLSKKTIEGRKKILGLDAKRADIIPAGIIILSEIFNQLNIEKMIISGYALREGIIIDTIQKTDNKLIHPKLRDIRLESVKHLAESCKYDMKHCYHVANLSLQLFDQLKEVHKLGNKEREYLEAASKLHDIGYHISHSQHHLHSMYIISNSELLGFNENEINIIANVARYHRKSHPKNRHSDFQDMPAKSREVVKKLSSILRVADSFDRTHFQQINELKTKIIDGKIHITTNKFNGNKDIELWSLNRRKALFEEIFSMEIVVE